MLVEYEGTQFRVLGPGISTGWWEDTQSNRNALVVFLRKLEDASGEPVFTHQQVASVVGSVHRQASDEPMQRFRDSGGDLGVYLARKRKVDGEVVHAVEQALREDAWLSLGGLADGVNRRLGREDLTGANMGCGLDQLSGRVVRGIYVKQVERGAAHYQESYVIDRLFSLALEHVEEAPRVAWEEGVVASLEQGTEVVGSARPGEVAELGDGGHVAQEALLEPVEEITEEGLQSLWLGPLGWVLWSLLLYVQGVSLSVIGRWVGVDKSTVCRWLSQVACWGWEWLRTQQVAFSGRLTVDEKWIKIGGVWWYLFAAVDCVSGYPLHVGLYPSNSGVYCKLFLLELKGLGYVPKVVITDGWDAYIQAIGAVFPHAEHLLCRFHVLRSVFRRLRKAGVWDRGVWKLAGKLFQTKDKRTVRRRVDQLQLLVEGLGVGSVVEGLISKLAQVLPAVGSTWRPSPANAVEGFFGAFDRFSRVKGPFRDVASAQKHVRLFVLSYVFGVGAQGQACPLEKAGQAVGKLPLYHLLNRPNVERLRQQMAPVYREAA